MEEKILKKKLSLIVFSAVLLIIMFNFSFTNATDPLEFSEKRFEIVEKVQGEIFTVEIGFKNTGKNEGKWNISIVFEGELWSQIGNSQYLELEPNEEKIMSWTGIVPTDAPLDSVARLVVYFEDSFKPLNWWIYVVPGAELTIKSSCVK